MAPKDYLAELYVAGLFAGGGWNIYFPHRDLGMDFIVSKTGTDGMEIIRPVQVKGKYPQEATKDRAAYGFVGELKQRHPLMVLAIAFFDSTASNQPTSVAYMPASKIRPDSRGYRCQPCVLKSVRAQARRDYRHYFDVPGLRQIELPSWG